MCGFPQCASGTVPRIIFLGDSSPGKCCDVFECVNGMLLQISCLQWQALGQSLASLMVARRQLWLSQARVPDMDKTVLLDVPISLGHTFGPAVEEILQRYSLQHGAG
ncbi:UNVERIFIED_CONTAM: hypothetical protein FKN15_037361 [Acipenser sinensis]